MAEEAKVYGWNDRVADEGGDGNYKTIAPGTYPFKVLKLEKEYFDGSAKLPPCPKAVYTLQVGLGEVSRHLDLHLMLVSSMGWKIHRFFEACNLKTPGDKDFQPRWDEAVGCTGWLELGKRKYTDKNGEEKETNDVKEWVLPADAEEARLKWTRETGGLKEPQPAQAQQPAQQAVVSPYDDSSIPF